LLKEISLLFVVRWTWTLSIWFWPKSARTRPTHEPDGLWLGERGDQSTLL